MELRFKNICKSFGEKMVLHDFSLDFPESGTVCFFGPSGCGKTTLLNCVAGLVKPDSGEISGLQGKKISCLFQEDRLLPWCTAQENVAAVLNKSEKQNAAEAAVWLERVGLSGEAHQYPSDLSGGMRQRVAIARALAYGGDIILMDEPFHALDEKAKAEVIALIQKKTPGALKLLVTHDEREAQTLADTVYFLSGPPLAVARVITKS